MNGNAIAVYYPACGQEILNVSSFADKSVRLFAWWYNPCDGKFYDQEGMKTDHSISVTVSEGYISIKTPAGKPEKDWVLIIMKERSAPPVTQKEYYAEEQTGEEKKVFAW